MIPSTENEIQYLIKNPPETRILRITPELHGKPVAMVSPLPYSPISNSLKDCPHVIQVNVLSIMALSFTMNV